jgi:hypothetical protein
VKELTIFFNKLITLTPKAFTPKIKATNEKDKQLTCSDTNRRFSRGFLFCLSFNQFITLIIHQKPIKSRDTSLIKLDFKKRVVATSIKIRRNRRKTTVSNPKKADQQKSLNCFFKTMAFSHTDQLNQLDPTNEREPPLKLTPYSP